MSDLKVSELDARLRKTAPFKTFTSTCRTAPIIEGVLLKPVNPDGPEAADTIATLTPDPVQSDGEGWETFSDASYFDMWCVRKVGQRTFGQGFHLVNGDEAQHLADLLTRLTSLSAPVA